MTYCAVKGCHNSSHNRQKHVKVPFHGFPTDPIVAARWIEKIRLNRKEPCWKPSKYTKICSVHFDENEKYLTKTGLCKLRESAIPTRGLHIFCTEDSQQNNDICKDDLHDLNKPAESHVIVSSNESNENVYLNTLNTFSLLQQQTIYTNEVMASNIPIHQENYSDLDPIFDTPRESAIRRQLNKKILLQRKHIKKIKVLQQQVRRLKKRNVYLQKVIKTLRNKKSIDNDTSNMLTVNVLPDNFIKVEPTYFEE